MFGIVKIDPKTRRRPLRSARKSKQGAMWMRSEAAATYIAMGDKYVVLNVDADPLQDGFVPTHKLREHLEHAAAD